MGTFLQSEARGGAESDTEKQKTKALDLAILRGLFRYEPSTGQIIRLTNQSSNARRGDVAGSPHNAGYLQLSVNGQKLLAHRLAWTLMTGDDPGELEVDHVNGDRSDNRWRNLRLATASQQRGNRVVKGFSRRRRHGRDEYLVVLCHQYLGCFKTEAEAVDCYNKAAEERWGEYAGSRRGNQQAAHN